MSTAEVIALYSCTKCEKAVHPVRQLRPSGGFVDACPRCGGGVVCEAKADEHRGEAPAAAAPQAMVARHPKSAAPVDDVLGIAKRRLEHVREQIAALRKFEAEEAMLERMVWAAEAE